MKREFFGVLIGGVVASLFFIVQSSGHREHNKDVQKRANSKGLEEQSSIDGVEKSYFKESTKTAVIDSILYTKGEKTTSSASSKPYQRTSSNTVGSDIIFFDKNFIAEPVVVSSSKQFEQTFYEQSIDHAWAQAVEYRIVDVLSESLIDTSVWLDNYECKYSMCRIELKGYNGVSQASQFNNQIWNEINRLGKQTNTTGLSIPNQKSDEDGFIFYLMRRGANEP